MNQSAVWEQLAPSMVVGVSRKPVSPELLARVLGSSTPGGDSLSATWTALHLCGQVTRVRGGLLERGAVTGPEPLAFEPETRPEAGEEWAGLARQVISNGRTDLLRAAVGELAEQAVRLPRQAVIPVTRCLLGSARGGTDETVRTALRETLGNLGRTVVAKHPTWSRELGLTPAGDRDVAWRDGTARERATLLAEQRVDDPDWARERLRETADVRAAGERREVLAVWEHRAEPADIEAVELFLKDRSAKVARLAERILSDIPGSDTARRRERDAAERLRDFADLSQTKLGEVLGILDPAHLPEVVGMSVDEFIARRPDSVGPLAHAAAGRGRHDLLLRLLREHPVPAASLSVDGVPPALREALVDAAEPDAQLHFLPQWRRWTPRMVDVLLDLVADVVEDPRTRPPLAGAVGGVVEELPLRAPLPTADWDPTPRLRELSRAEEAGRAMSDLLLRTAADYSLRHQLSASLTRSRS